MSRQCLDCRTRPQATQYGLCESCSDRWVERAFAQIHAKPDPKPVTRRDRRRRSDDDADDADAGGQSTLEDW